MGHLAPNAMETFTQLVRARAERHPDAVAMRYLDRGEVESQRLTYAELDRRARAIAVLLLQHAQPGDRVLLMFAPGLDFVATFVAALYAGVIAVPAYPPDIHRIEHAVRRLQAVIDDAAPKVLITTPDILAMAKPFSQGVPGAERLLQTPWIAHTDGDALADRWQAPDIHGDTLAFLQYTSGSTGNPKGAMLSHRNLLRDLEMLQVSLGNTEHRPLDTACWVPLYHDLGLIGHVLGALYTGATCSVISPIDFLKKPLRWLRLLSDTRAAITGAPNFAFDLAVRKVSAAEVETLDLSHVIQMGNCAEPVRASTIERFYRHFAPAGLKRSAIAPCYGLAEATVLVTNAPRDRRPTFLNVDRDKLEHHQVAVVDASDPRAVTLVGCGKAWSGCQVEVVDPVSEERVSPGRVGEIWVSGPNLASGYWQRKEATQETFGGRLAGSSEPYLRTGDLGFVHDDDLYVTGRLKDLVIVRGRNLYPQDVERAVDDQKAEVPAIRPGCSAAFAWTVNDSEELVLMQEVSDGDGSLDPQQTVQEIRRIIFEAFEVQPHEVVLLKSGSIPKTSSGKIMRRSCKEAYRSAFTNGVVEVVFRERAAQSGPRTVVDPAASTEPPASILEPFSSYEPQTLPEPEAPLGASAQSRKRADDLLEWLRDWAPQRLEPTSGDAPRPLAPHVLLDLGNAGILGMRVPEGRGGLGLSSVDQTRVLQQLAAIDLTLATMTGLNGALGIHPLLVFGSAALKDDLLPDLARGRKLGAFALATRGVGWGSGINAIPDPVGTGHFRLTGDMREVGLGAVASVVTVFGRHEGSEQGVSAFAVSLPQRGLRWGAEASPWAGRALVRANMSLTDVKVSERELLGALGKGFGVAVSSMAEARLAVAATALGGMKRALQVSARYANQTTEKGLLFDTALTRERMTEAAFGTLALSSLVTRVASLRDASANLPAELFAATNVGATELFWTTADHLVQMLGDRGSAEANEAARLLRDARTLRILEGPTETLRMHLGGSLLRAGPRWRALLSSNLRAPRAAARLADAVEKLREGLGPRPEPVVRRLVQHRAGIALAWAILVAALEAGGGRGKLFARATAWLSARFDGAIAEAKAAPGLIHDLPDANELREVVGKFASHVGDIDLAILDRDIPPPRPAALPIPVAIPVSGISSAPRPRGTPTKTETAGDSDTRKTLHSGGSGETLDVTAGLRLDLPLEAPADQDPVVGEVSRWLVAWVEETLHVPAAQIRLDEPLTSYGVDSLAVVEATGDIEAHFGVEVPESAFWDHRTIQALSKYIAARVKGPKRD